MVVSRESYLPSSFEEGSTDTTAVEPKGLGEGVFCFYLFIYFLLRSSFIALQRGKVSSHCLAKRIKRTTFSYIPLFLKHIDVNVVCFNQERFVEANRRKYKR